MAMNGTIRINFLCAGNTGRSQMAAALAERERDERGLYGSIKVYSAGTNPADRIDETVVEAMEEIGVDISGRTPSYVVLDDLEESDYVVSMGCPIRDFNLAQYGVISRSWNLENPEGADIKTVRAIRDELQIQVELLFDEIEATANDLAPEPSLTTRVRSAVKDTLML